MPLQLPQGARFSRGAVEEGLSQAAVSAFDELVLRIAAQGNRKELLEHFKGFFSTAVGAAHYRSSNEDWAYSDLQSCMRSAAKSPAIFIEAFYDACEDLRAVEEYELPNVAYINETLREHNIGFEIQPPRLNRVSEVARIPAPEVPLTLNEEAAAMIKKSLQRGEQLLVEGHTREAVQEMLWILESISTVFRGLTLPNGTIQGKYFNEIARELKGAAGGTTLGRVIDWATQLHGYLSSPTGGGVRHGVDLNSGVAISNEDGRLFCNLIISFVTYLMATHENLHRSQAR